MDPPSGPGPGAVLLPRALDPTALHVPLVGLGTWAWGSPKWGWGTWDPHLSQRSVAAAWDAFIACGGGLVDTSDDYGGGLAEECIGAGLRRSGGAGVVLATKGATRPSQLVAAAAASCKRLGVECVQLVCAWCCASVTGLGLWGGQRAAVAQQTAGGRSSRSPPNTSPTCVEEPSPDVVKPLISS